uniref:Peptidase A1 domain-containing protein n=1 Tax=Oryza nivara TaxID=4536 RepID=A0A0E0FR71_ORYNI
MAGRRRVVVLVVAAALLVAVASPGASGKSARFELLRLAPAASLADLARMDRERMAFISSRGRRRATETASAFAMPLSSGAYTGTGQYFVRFRVGTPAQPFLLVADTGSDLTWVKCHRAAAAASASPRNASSLPAPAPASPRRTFRPDKSRTWAPIPCSSATCRESLPFSLAACATPANPCAYDYRYKDGSAARGTVGVDSATIALSGRAARKAKLRGVVLGCTTSYNGQSFLASDGVLSLGYSNISFASRAASRFGGRFSYCLTPLVLDHRTRPFYAVTVKGVSVAGELLKIPRAVWDVEQGGGAILDSGTSLTMLAKPAYRAVVAALSKRLAGLPRVTMDPFDYCYNWTSPSGSDVAAPLPMLAVHFAGSARLEPPAKSYVIDAAPGVKCIGLQEGPWPGLSVIGNILQQEHLWEYDLKNRRLRFKRSRCMH